MCNPNIVELFGETLQGKSGSVKTADALAGKVVGLYFSAHWCGPCRSFTPTLAQAYKDIVASGKNLEIVFLSSDRDDSSFNEYYGEMPWLALPFSERAKKEFLSKFYKVAGIPTLVFVDEQGQTITTKGRAAISSDPSGENFPWIPPTLEEALGDEFIKNDGTVVTRASLSGKKLALYFSAHWCGPCRSFTPQLSKLYNSMKASGRDDFEFIFCSSDRDEESFNKYHSEMPWLALPYSNRKGKEALSSRFEVRGIPTLVTIDENGCTITTDARGRADADPEGKEFPWPPKPMNDFSEGPGDINEFPSLCLMMEKCTAEKQAELEAILLPMAEAVFAEKAKPDSDPSMLFFTAKSEGQIAKQLRSMASLGLCEDNKPQLVLLDLGAGGKYYSFPGNEITTESVKNFIDFFKAGSLEAQQMSR